MKTVLFSIDDKEVEMVEALKPFFKTKARSKVFKKSMNYTYTNLKNLNIIKVKP